MSVLLKKRSYSLVKVYGASELPQAEQVLLLHHHVDQRGDVFKHGQFHQNHHKSKSACEEILSASASAQHQDFEEERVGSVEWESNQRPECRLNSQVLIVLVV